MKPTRRAWSQASQSWPFTSCIAGAIASASVLASMTFGGLWTSTGWLSSLSRQLHPLRCKHQPSFAINRADSPRGFDPAFLCSLAALFAIELSHGPLITRITCSGSM